MTVEAGCDDSNDDFVAKFFVNACAEDDVCAAVNDVLNEFGRFRDFRKRNIKTAGNVDDDAGCTFDIGFEQRGLYSLTDCFESAVFALAATDTHVARPLSDITVRTSLKSRLIRAGLTIRSEIPWIP